MSYWVRSTDSFEGYLMALLSKLQSGSVPNNSFQPTYLPPLRCGKSEAEARRSNRQTVACKMNLGQQQPRPPLASD